MKIIIAEGIDTLRDKLHPRFVVKMIKMKGKKHERFNRRIKR